MPSVVIALVLAGSVGESAQIIHELELDFPLIEFFLALYAVLRDCLKARACNFAKTSNC